MSDNVDNIDIDAELNSLRIRKEKLQRLLALRAEVCALEKGAFYGEDAKWTVQIITEEVCSRFNLTLERLASRSRQTEVATPRQIIFYIVRELKSVPYVQIGRLFHRDHGTVIYGYNQIRDRIPIDAKLREDVSHLMRVCSTRLEESQRTPDAVRN